MTVITFGSRDYPERLCDLANPPDRLFVRSPVGADQLAILLAPPLVAIVGSRNASVAGVAFARRLAGELAASGVGVVSGLARGIDAGAHEGALERSGRTVAVLGCGIDRDYPSATIPLARRITTKGAVLSEYSPGTPPAPFRFPERNRIVAALADATIVIEAAARRYRLDLKSSWMVGDSSRDMECARKAGLRGILVGGGDATADRRVVDLPKAVEMILRECGLSRTGAEASLTTR